MPLLSTIGAAAARAFGFLRALVTGGYSVANSLRFNSGSSDYLNRNSNNNTAPTKATWSFWVKRSKISDIQRMSMAMTSGFAKYHFIRFEDDLLVIANDTGINYVLTQRFRDVSAWYHLVVAVDTTLATSSDRVKVYINGSQVTAFTTATAPTQNSGIFIGETSNAPFVIGALYGVGYGITTGSPTEFYSGYMSEFYLIDGQALTPSSFGETDTLSGIWKPKAYTGSFGTNGFYLKFANSAALGTDSSGNGNTFTVNNLTSVDQSTDTPTNNFSTLNPLDFGNNATSYATFSEGNLKAVGNTSAWRGAHGTMGVSKGKWYYEGKAIGIPDGDTGVYIGWCDPALATTYDVAGNNADYNFYIWTNQAIRFNNSITTSYYSFTQDDICGFALDLDNGKGYISKNGTFYNNGNTSSTPNTGSPDFTITLPPTNNGVLVPCILAYNDGGFFLNFGSPPYSANSYADAEGYGNFSYAVPAGYYSLCTKNLAEYA